MIQASWEEICPIIATLLNEKFVHYLNLSLKYLPALETLNANPSRKKELYSYDKRLSLGFDNQIFIW